MKSRLFIGSSVEGLKVAEAIQELMRFDVFSRIWTQGVFNLSSTTLDDLIAALQKHEFAIFVLSPDDITILRDNHIRTARDNVIFELGLFIGHLGKKNVFFLIPEGFDNLHIPTDLLGVNPGKYYYTDNVEDLLAGLGSFCNQIRRQIKQVNSSNGISLEGIWCERWLLEGTRSQLFQTVNEDKNVEVKQKGDNVFAEFKSGGRTYKIAGKIKDYFLTGTWEDAQFGANYHGAFQLKIGINAQTMTGLWIGFDSELQTIRQSKWEWKRTEATRYPSDV